MLSDGAAEGTAADGPIGTDRLDCAAAVVMWSCNWTTSRGIAVVRDNGTVNYLGVRCRWIGDSVVGSVGIRRWPTGDCGSPRS